MRDSTPTRWNPAPVKKDPPCGTCRPLIHRWNVDAVSMYARCAGQWNYNPVSGNAVSLKTTEIEAEMRIVGIKKKHRAQLVDDVRALAAFVVQCWDRERERLRESSNGRTQN